MPELTNQDIDDIFQRGAEHYDFDFDEEAWKQMESLLKRDRRRRLLWWFIGILLAFLLSFGAYQLLFNHSQVVPAPRGEEPAPIADDMEEVPPGKLSGNGKETTTEPDVLPPRPGAKTTGEDKVPQSSSSPQARQAESPAKRADIPPPGSVAESGTVADEAGKHGQARPTPLAPLEKLPPTDSIISTDRRYALLSSPSAPATLEILPRRKMEALAGEFQALPPPKDSGPPIGNEETKPANALVIGASFSPESASVGTDDFGKVDFKAGVSFEYRFATHFGIGAGIHYTRKHYEAGRGEYTPEKGFWTRQIAPERSFGYCSMLEVPLNVTYFLRRHDRNSLFLEAGLSNFIMLNEHYWYSYDRPDPDLIRYWKSNFEYHNWMGILNISPGYQARLSNRFGIQAAPFIQIPITGVGHGNVDLYSIGLNLRLLFRLPKGR